MFSFYQSPGLDLRFVWRYVFPMHISSGFAHSAADGKTETITEQLDSFASLDEGTTTELNEGTTTELVTGRRGGGGGVLMTSGSFTIMSNRGGNSEEDEEDESAEGGKPASAMPAQTTQFLQDSVGASQTAQNVTKNKAKCALPGDSTGIVGTLVCPDGVPGKDGKKDYCPDSLNSGRPGGTGYKYLDFLTNGRATCRSFKHHRALKGVTSSVLYCHKKYSDKNCNKYYKRRITTKAQIVKVEGDWDSVMVAFKRVACDDNNGGKACDTYKIGFCVTCPKNTKDAKHTCVTCPNNKKDAKHWFKSHHQHQATDPDLKHAAGKCVPKALQDGKVKEGYQCRNRKVKAWSESFLEAF